jgi:thioredoxin-dependent peroxiredoxin
MASKKVSKKNSKKKAAVKKAAKKAPAKKAGKKAPAKKAAKKKAPAKKAAKKKAPAKKAPAKKAAKKKAPAKKAPAKKAPPVKVPVKPAIETAISAAKKAVKKVVKKAVEKVTDLVDAAATAPGLEVGAAAPAFSLPDQNGSTVSSADLAGKPYVLYFYPKDDTPGCTKEACDFRDDYHTFQSAGIAVLGVSPDSTKSHAGFAEKYSLPFPLLVDADKTLASAYGAWGKKQNYGKEYMGIIRSTFVVGKDGRVAAVYRGVKVDGHVAKVLARALEGAA